MLDDSIPLTTNEYDEWGDPNEREYYDYMLSYSPYDNVAAQAYPAMLVTTGLWDSQVQYFEPAKWVARLRRLKTDDTPLLLRVNMEAGHGGKSGRFQRYREVAEEYAFMLDQAGIRRGCDTLASRRRDREAALAHQRLDARVAAAERAVAVGRVDGVADREDVVAAAASRRPCRTARPPR